MPGFEHFFLLQLPHALSCTHTNGCLRQATYPFPRVVSTAGSGWFSLMTYPFSLLMSTHTLTWLLLSGVITMDTHCWGFPGADPGFFLGVSAPVRDDVTDGEVKKI